MTSIQEISRDLKQQFIDSLDLTNGSDTAHPDQDKSQFGSAFLNHLAMLRHEISPLVFPVNADLIHRLSGSTMLSRLNTNHGAVLGFTSPALAKVVVQDYVSSQNVAKWLTVCGPQPGTLADKQLTRALRMIRDGALSNVTPTLDRYLELNPSDFIAHQVLGFTAFCENDILKSKKEFSLAIKHVKAGSTRDLVFSKLCLASLYGIDNDLSYAFHVCSEAIVLNGPSIPEGYYLYGILGLMNGERQQNMTDYLIAAFWGNPALVFLPVSPTMSAEMYLFYERTLSEFYLETSTLARTLITRYMALRTSLRGLKCDACPDAFSPIIHRLDTEIIPYAEKLLSESTILGNLLALDALAKSKNVVKDAVHRIGKRIYSNLNHAAFQLDSKDSIRIDLAQKAIAWTTSERDSLIFGSAWVGAFLIPIIGLVSPGDLVSKLLLIVFGGPLGIVLGLAFGAIMAMVFKAEADAYVKKISIRNPESERLKLEASALGKAIDELLTRTFSN